MLKPDLSRSVNAELYTSTYSKLNCPHLCGAAHKVSNELYASAYLTRKETKQSVTETWVHFVFVLFQRAVRYFSPILKLLLPFIASRLQNFSYLLLQKVSVYRVAERMKIDGFWVWMVIPICTAIQVLQSLRFEFRCVPCSFRRKMCSAQSCRSTLPVYSPDEASIMPVHMGISWDRERKGEERDRDERRGGKKTRWKQREGVRKKRKASGKEQERAQGGAFIFIFLNILQITKHGLFIGNSIS